MLEKLRILSTFGNDCQLDNTVRSSFSKDLLRLVQKPAKTDPRKGQKSRYYKGGQVSNDSSSRGDMDRKLRSRINEATMFDSLSVEIENKGSARDYPSLGLEYMRGTSCNSNKIKKTKEERISLPSYWHFHVCQYHSRMHLSVLWIIITHF